MSDNRTCLDRGVSHDNGIFYNGAFFHRDTGKQDGMSDGTLDVTSIGNQTVIQHGILSDPVTGHTTVSAVNFPVFIKQVDAAMFRIKHFHVCFPQRRNRSYILPVSVEMIGIHLSSVTQKIWNDIVSKIILGSRVSLILDQIFL